MEALPLTPGESFPSSLRLHLRRDFTRAFDQGRKTVHSDAILWVSHRGDPGPSRLGIVVSRKLGTAVKRNRLKRLVRETFRRSKGVLKPGMDMVVYLRPGGCRWNGLQEAISSLHGLWKRADLIADDSARR